jgi:hypothetical protein
LKEKPFYRLASFGKTVTERSFDIRDQENKEKDAVGLGQVHHASCITVRCIKDLEPTAEQKILRIAIPSYRKWMCSRTVNVCGRKISSYASCLRLATSQILPLGTTGAGMSRLSAQELLLIASIGH